MKWRLTKYPIFNSLRQSDAYMHQYNIPTLLQIMACHLFGAKPLSEPMLPYCQLDHKEHISVKFYSKFKLEIVDQWSTRIPPPHRRGWQWVDCNWTLFKITRQPFWKRHSWQSLGFCLEPQRTCTWNLKLKFQSKLELRSRNHGIQKPKNLICPPGSHLENEVTENQQALTHIHKYFATEVWSWYSKPN